MSLRHIPIPSTPWAHPPVCPTYNLATRIQTKLQEDLLSWKAAGGTSSSAPPPRPALMTFTPAPTFTLGRRQPPPTSAERAEMSKRLICETYRPASRADFSFLKPAIVQTPRGGLTTYHGPGQVLFWPIIDLKSPLHNHFTVRSYVSLLEKTTLETLRKAYNISGFTDPKNPGVWARKSRIVMGPDGDDIEVEGQEEKVAALGVHLRRNVTGLGIAINFRMPLSSNPKENPFVRISPCGMESDAVTSVAKLSGRTLPLEDAVDTLIPMWADEFARQLGVANAANRDAGPLVEADTWINWAIDMGIVKRKNSGFEIARKRKH
ncbi:uncharacterized protein GGS22DRAFT_27361 [Annulohypoxylon maeteangense]|uniref:uncharacterized protein n=1 Tax=Annulohypoxylon maeteangense TaxID=1927788 RepID=UPI002008BC90|nr:uncharacterized protein GGS22DRAFT_27361 [Annulohypoxylon maeteangense]KAI0883911.1 hypothetical protein GGS22DRAFT_27361 [Annulohypoxylon maeteangense]